MNKKHVWTMIIVLGIVMIAGAAGLVLNNALTAQKAKDNSNSVLLELDRLSSYVEEGSETQQLPQVVSDRPVSSGTVDEYHDSETSSNSASDGNNVVVSDETHNDGTQQLAYVASEQTMPAVTVNGHDYIGKLSIPALRLVLPIMDEFSYDNLNIAPTRYYGDIETNDFVICAHNYDAHFGRLKNLQKGSTVEFADLSGTTYRYEVISVDTIEPTAIDEVISGTNDLILLTCTTGGRARVIARCDRID